MTAIGAVIATLPFRFAKTMPDNPHEYTVRSAATEEAYGLTPPLRFKQKTSALGLSDSPFLPCNEKPESYAQKGAGNYW
jgi:hypothetical protein